MCFYVSSRFWARQYITSYILWTERILVLLSIWLKVYFLSNRIHWVCLISYQLIIAALEVMSLLEMPYMLLIGRRYNTYKKTPPPLLYAPESILSSQNCTSYLFEIKTTVRDISLPFWQTFQEYRSYGVQTCCFHKDFLLWL